jgi:hypothetical protein
LDLWIDPIPFRSFQWVLDVVMMMMMMIPDDDDDDDENIVRSRVAIRMPHMIVIHNVGVVEAIVVTCHHHYYYHESDSETIKSNYKS